MKTMLVALLMFSFAIGCAGPDPSLKVLGTSAAKKIKVSMDAAREAETRVPALGRSAAEMTKASEAKATEAGESEATNEFKDTIKVCSAVLNKYSWKSDLVTYARIGLGVAGAVAGGVVIPALTAAAPLANSVAISALGGVSGVTNGVLAGLSDGGLSPGPILLARAKVREEVMTALNEYYKAMDAGNPEKAGRELNRARASCAFYIIEAPGTVPSDDEGSK